MYIVLSAARRAMVLRNYSFLSLQIFWYSELFDTELFLWFKMATVQCCGTIIALRGQDCCSRDLTIGSFECERKTGHNHSLEMHAQDMCSNLLSGFTQQR